MKHSPFQKTFKLFWILTAVTIAVRFWLQFTQIDHTSGFYNATALGRGCQLGFNALLAVCALLIWLSVRRHGKDFSAERKPFGREFFIGLIVMVALHSTVVSPKRTRQEPPARPHILPVSNLMLLPARVVSNTWKFSNILCIPPFL